ncbi:HAD family phosphatase [Antiquaquibacter oligotrophicus]|nr:HAD family phosphatase [Antiquaquibacter oligotrophicus]
MDGTLVDTEPYWVSAETDLIESFGGSWTHEEALQLVGAGLWHSARIIQAKGVALTEDEIIDALTDRVLEQLATKGIPWRPGARELLLELREAGVPTALVTMSISRMAHFVVEHLGFEGFDAVVSGNDVTHSKPHPEPYLHAARILGVDPALSVALEDSPPGVASAAEAGMVTIGIPFILDLTSSSATHLWPTLDGRTLADLAALVPAVSS